MIAQSYRHIHTHISGWLPRIRSDGQATLGRGSAQPRRPIQLCLSTRGPVMCEEHRQDRQSSRSLTTHTKSNPYSGTLQFISASRSLF